MIDWIIARQENHGLWDFGSRDAESVHFRLTDDWRSSRAREHEWSLRVVWLLRKHLPP
jgi:hypothetical protein